MVFAVAACLCGALPASFQASQAHRLKYISMGIAATRKKLPLLSTPGTTPKPTLTFAPPAHPLLSYFRTG